MSDDAPDSRSVRALFDRMIDLSPAEREALIAAESITPPLARAVYELLGAAHELPTGFLGESRFEPPPDEDVPARQIGPYTIGGLLGEGGMGRVYRAQQRTPIQRTVAVKLIRPGFDTTELIRRFEAERDTLARLDHPNIARVLDAGSTGANRPYFVVEYVPGVAITRFCDERRLNVDGRLRLFAQVCDAIAHAHTKGVIHRDLKPSNVLAFVQDGKPVVKVIDFGIAKLLDAPEAGKTFHTRTGLVLGTYEYMSPEQASGSTDVDTRSDVYSLGVLLYELLVGALPFSADTFGRAADRQIRHLISEQDPPRPAVRLSALGETVGDVAARRDLGPAQLSRLLRGELEWIPLKALRKERERRYAGVTELRNDVENYLAGRPLVAAPESMTYRVRKFARRNRLAVAVTAGALALLVLAGVVYFVGVRREQRRTLAALAQNRAVNAFLEDMLSSIDPARARGEPALVRDVVVRADTELDRQALLAPSSRAGLRLTLAQTLLAIGEPQRALTQLDKMGSDRAALDAASAVRADQTRAAALDELGRFDDAERVIRSAIDRARLPAGDAQGVELQSDLGRALLRHGQLNDAVSTLAAAHDRRAALPTDRQVELERRYATAIRAAGRPREALAVYQAAMALAADTLGSQHPTTIALRAEAGDLLRTLGRHAEAEPLLTDALAQARRVAGEDHPLTLRCANAEALLLADTDRPAEAKALAEATLARTSTRFGGDHPDAIDGQATLAALLDAAGRAAESEAAWRAVFLARTRLLGAAHPDTLDAASGWAYAVLTCSRVDDARAAMLTARDALASALAIARRTLGDDHPVTLGLLSNFASTFEVHAESRRALACYAELLERRTRTTPGGVELIGVYNNYANVLRGLNRLDEALAFDLKALDARRRTFGEGHSWVTQSYSNLALTLMKLGRSDEADRYARLGYDGRARALGPDHPSTLGSLSVLAMAEERDGRTEEAERAFRSSFEAQLRTLGETSPGTLNARINLGSFLQRHGRPAEAEPLLRRSYADVLAQLGPTHGNTAMVARRFAFCLDTLGKTAEADALRAKHGIAAEPPEAAVAMPKIR